MDQKSGLDDQPPAYQATPGYPVALGHDSTGFVGHPYVGQGPYTGQVPVIVQPPVFVAPAPVPQNFPDYLCYSIFTMVCCCLPLGIAALIYSINTREANMAGDGGRAERSSRLARLLNNISLGIGIVVYVITIILFVVSVTVVKPHH